MLKETEDRLLELNRQFYNAFAEAFSDSRGRSEPGFERIVAQIEPGERVLDLGCGQGRLAQLLPPSCAYVGVDSAAEMLQIAAERTQSTGTPATFVESDLVEGNWPTLVGDPFDWIILRAVLHHIPGYHNRRDVVAQARQLLAPTGHIVIANWQFLRIERLRRRLVPWSEQDISADDVEDGDYLLDWHRQGRGTRYAHLLDEPETLHLASDTGLHVEELFYADGHTNDLTLYAVLGAPGSGAAP